MTKTLEILRYYHDAGQLTLDLNFCMDIMKRWYHNYRFTEKAQDILFNEDVDVFKIDMWELSDMITNMAYDGEGDDEDKLDKLLIELMTVEIVNTFVKLHTYSFAALLLNLPYQLIESYLLLIVENERRSLLQRFLQSLYFPGHLHQS